jgi:glycerol uptake facilitator-like aquaporin
MKFIPPDSATQGRWVKWQFDPTRIWRPLAFEFFSAFIFFCVIYAVSLNLQLSPALQPYSPSTLVIEALATGFMFVILVVNMGPLCGAALNPVVSIALMLIGEHSIIKTICYIGAQLGAASLAATIIPLLYTSFSAETGYPTDVALKLVARTRAATAPTNAPAYATIVVTAVLLELLFSFIFTFFLSCNLFEPESLIYIPQKSTTTSRRDMVQLMEESKARRDRPARESASSQGSFSPIATQALSEREEEEEPYDNLSMTDSTDLNLIRSPSPPGIIIPSREFIVDPVHNVHLQLSPYWYRLENSMFNGTYIMRQFIAALLTGFLLFVLIASGIIFNPARIFGPSLVCNRWQATWIYWVGPASGAIIGVLSYKYIYLPSRTAAIWRETKFADRRYRLAL